MLGIVGSCNLRKLLLAGAAQVKGLAGRWQKARRERGEAIRWGRCRIATQTYTSVVLLLLPLPSVPLRLLLLLWLLLLLLGV